MPTTENYDRQLLEDALELEAQDPGPETELELEEEEFVQPRKRRPKLRPEAVLGLLTLVSALIFAVTLLLCRPYFIPAAESQATEPFPQESISEDPDALEQLHHLAGLALPSEPAESQEDPAVPEETLPEPEKNPYDKYDFQYTRHNYLLCRRQKSYPGIDVSAYQGNIDWEKVKNSGIRFAIIRLGYRGYGSGKLVEDEYAQNNLEGASEAGLPIGAYFFSQALNIREVDEEIKYMLEILGDRRLDMPIILDWEIPTSDSRTANMDARTLTDLQKHFCETMTEKGYQPMVYFNWHMSSNLLHLTELEDYPFWLALYQDSMTYPYRIEMWQYTDQGKVPGINGNVDINVYIPAE